MKRSYDETSMKKLKKTWDGNYKRLKKSFTYLQTLAEDYSSWIQIQQDADELYQNIMMTEHESPQDVILIFQFLIFERVVGRAIQLTKDYTTGNETFKQGSRGTVIEATSRKDRKLKVKFNNDTKKYRLIKGCDLQLYEGVQLFYLTTLNHRQRKPLLNAKQFTMFYINEYLNHF